MTEKEALGHSAVKTSTLNDPFDPARLRISQNFIEGASVRRELLGVPVRKPNPQKFIRVRKGDEYRLDAAAVIELKEDKGANETYLVLPHLLGVPEIQKEVSPRRLFTAIDRQNELFVWSVKLPGGNKKADLWSATCLDAARIAEDHWVRVQANMGLGAYDAFKAVGEFPEPEWPDHTFAQILRIAFRDRIIESVEHPVIQKLRGAV